MHLDITGTASVLEENRYISEGGTSLGMGRWQYSFLYIGTGAAVSTSEHSEVER